MIDRSSDVMGDYWSWAVLAAAFFRLRRFDEIHEALGVATNILADRLGRMVLHGVLRKDLYQKAPPRFEYRLTEAGWTCSRSSWPCTAGASAGSARTGRPCI